MADRYWVGGTGTWNSTNTANWSASSGGASGASVPTAADNVFFNANSNVGTGAFTVTMADTPRVCNDITISGLDGTMTLAGASIGLNVSGSLSFPATNFTRTYTGTTTFNATTTGKTITTNGVAFGGGVTLDGVGGGWTLGSALTMGATNTLALFNGTFNTSVSNYAVSGQSFLSSNSNIRTITLNNSTLTFSTTGTGWNMATSTNATLNAGNSTIALSSSAPTFAGGGLTYYNVSFTTTTATPLTKSITGANTFNNLTFSTISSAGLNNISIGADQTINGTLTVNGSNGNRRQFVRSSVIGTSCTLTCAAIAAMTDVDFRDITIAGAAGTLSGTRLGDCGGNSNITFVAGINKYWGIFPGGNWNDNSWSTSPGGGIATTNYPLPQDTAIIQNTGLNTGATITINGNWNIGTLDTSTRTNAMTLASSTNTPTFYGNFTYGSGVTPTGTGIYTFSNRSTKTLNSGGITFTQPVTINAPGGGIQLVTNDLTLGSTLTTTLSFGTLDLNNLTLTTGGFSSTNSNTRTIAFGTGNITCSGTGTVWTTTTVIGLTTTGTQVVNVTSAGSTAITVNSGALSETNSISYNFTGGTYALTFLDTNGYTARNVNFTGYAGTLGATSGVTVYGNLTLSTGMSLTASASSMLFGATSGTRTITSNGKTMDFQINFNAPGATYVLQDAMTVGSTRNTAFTAGTVNLAGFTLTTGTASSQGANTRNITFNGGTLLISGSGATAWNASGAGGFSTTQGTGTGTISMTAATAKTFVGGGSTYNCTLNQGGAGTLTITGANTFNDITNTNATASQITFPASTTTTVNAFTLSGSSGNLVSLRSSTGGTRFTLSDASGTVSVSFLDIQDSNATGGATWNAFTSNGNVDSGNNLGWIFAGGGNVYAVSISETATGADTITLFLTRVGAVSETATGADTTASQLTTSGAISETATATDADSVTLTSVGFVDETATGADDLTATASLQLFVNETTTGADEITNIASLQLFVDETATAQDLPLGNIIATLQINEGATILDESLARLLWELINDNQLPGWQLIPNNQGSGWTIINTQAGGSWTNIDTV